MHGVSKFQQIQRQAARAQKLEEEDFLKNRNTYLSAIADVEDAPDTRRDEVESGGDMFSDIDRAISMKQSEFVKQGLLQPNPPKTASSKKIEEEDGEEGDVTDAVDELDEEEVVDLDEIDKLTGLTEFSDEEDWMDEEGNTRINKRKEIGADHQFEFDLDDFAVVAVGIAVRAPLEDIVRGIEEVDAVPGRCELIDDEQAFGVIVDHANTPDGLSRLLYFVRELKPRRIITGV